MQKLGDRFNRWILLLFAVLYAGIELLVLFFNSSFQYRPLFQIVLIGAWGCVLLAALWCWKYIGGWCRRHKRLVVAAVLVPVFLVQLAISLQTVPNPMYDHGKVFWGAVYYAQNGAVGNGFAVYDGYLHHYPNNMGLFLLQQLLFCGLHLVGVEADYMAAAVAGHLLFSATLWFGFLYLDEAFDTDTAFFFLLAALLYLPVYFQSTVSYTDTWSMWSIPCTLLCLHRAQRAATRQKKLLYGGLCGALLATAAEIKVTVLIIVIALLVQWILQGKIKQMLLPLAAAALLFAAVAVGFNNWKYSTVLDHDRDHEALPKTHWLMMGLQEDGSYSWIDEWLITSSVYGKEARMQLNLQVIGERLQEMGPVGYLQLLVRKTCRSFGAGTADLRYSMMYDDNSQPINLVYHLVLENGAYYSVFNNLSHSMYLMLLFLAIIGALCGLKKGSLQQQCSGLYLGLIGFWMFMMLWESNHRQWINQWSLLFMLAAIGLRQLQQRLNRRSAKIVLQNSGR